MKYTFIIFFLFFKSLSGFSQTGTFMVSGGQRVDRVTLTPLGCTTTKLKLCNTYVNIISSIALDGNILYTVNGSGYLYSGIVTSTDSVVNCTQVGRFLSNSSSYFGLTVGPGGVVYVARSNQIETYDPSTGTFAYLPGKLPNGWVIGGDLVFYKGKLYEAIISGLKNALIEIDLNNIANSTLVMNFTAPAVIGLVSTTVACSDNQVYAVSNSNGSKFYALDMVNKTQAPTPTCSVLFGVGDACSIAETQTGQTAIPTVISPYNICQGGVFNFTNPTVSAANDTLRWYTQAIGGTSYGFPTPAINTSVLGVTKYYISAYNTVTDCESERDSIIININPYPAPTITPADSTSICTGTSTTLTSSSATNNQWLFNGTPITGATNQTYTTGVIGNYSVKVTTNEGCSKVSSPTKIFVADTVKSFNTKRVCVGDLPYTWFGITFNNAGTKIKYLKSVVAGCDSAATLILNVDSPVTKNIRLFDCNQIVYNGKIYTNSQTVRDTIRSITLCDSIYAIAEITIALPPKTVTKNFYDCSFVLYKGITYTSSAIVKDTVYTTTGCDSIYNVANITIAKPVFKDTLKYYSTCNQFIYKNITYTVSAIILDSVIKTQNGICDSIQHYFKIDITPVLLKSIDKYYSSCDSVTLNGVDFFNSFTRTDTLKSYQGCDSIYTNYTINIFPKPTIKFNSSIIYTTVNTPVLLSPTVTDADKYLWSPSIYLDNPAIQSPYCTPRKEMHYKLQATSDSGCVKVGYVRVVVETPIKIPNVFSPNNDGINDTWQIEYLYSHPKAVVQIFNRYGQLLYKCSPGSYKPWNGKYKDADVPLGVYYYIINLSPNEAPIAGHVTILR